MKNTSQKIVLFQKKILSWYEKNKRDLPWRKTRDPYNILISEVMLQQTQVSRVIPKYQAWIKIFPTIEHVAKAPTAEVLRIWSGLGYNRRALYIQKVAKALTERNTGSGKRDVIWPKTEKELMRLPGIGKYTSRAIVCFAFDQQVAVVDTNVRKVILTQLYNENPPGNIFLCLGDSDREISVTEKDIEKIAEEILPHGKAYEWNQALMDYSSAMLKEYKRAVPKQSKFKDSDRYYRGAIVRFLIQHKQLSFEEIHELCIKDKKMVEKSRLKKILERLQKDALVIQKRKTYTLP